VSEDKKHQHFIIHKPYNYLSQFVIRTNHKMKLLGELHDFPEGTMAIGRLDKTSEGLLFLTTDGQMSELVRSSKVEKEYYAQVDGIMTESAIEQLKSGVKIGVDGGHYFTKPCKASILNPQPIFPERARRIRHERHGPTSWVSIILREGKFRQVRKMSAAVGFPTLRLFRMRIGDIWLGDMKPGEVRAVDSFF